MLYNRRGIENVLYSEKKIRKIYYFDIEQLGRKENVVIVGIPDKYKEQINRKLKNVRFIDNNLDFNSELLSNTDFILLSNMNNNYALSYKIECIANRKKIPVGNLLFKVDSTTIGHISETVMHIFAF